MRSGRDTRRGGRRNSGGWVWLPSAHRALVLAGAALLVAAALTAPPGPLLAQDQGSSVATDRAALVALYDATDGPNWLDSTNWGSDAPLGSWHGVTTDPAGRVIELSLASNHLRGPLPHALGHLTQLRQLNLGENQLSGPIPESLGDLVSLRGLILPSNQLAGPIPPTLGNLANLRRLWLTRNRLTGPIPASMGNLANLESLLLSQTQLSGPIPATLGNLVNLRSLSLSDNQLSGPIPAELSDLVHLRSLSLAINQLSGPIPAELGNLANLEQLDLSSNQLSGPIPPTLGRLGKLRGLVLSSTQLSGPIPPALGQLTQLRQLYLIDNQLSGPIPPALGQLVNLRELFLWSNQLSGPIPAELGNLVNLEHLDLSANQLSGPIPPALGRLGELRWLVLSANQLSGPIPPALGQLVNLRDLRLENNRLSGPIPGTLGDLVHLRILNLSGNQLNGPIPPALGRLGELRWLSLSANRLSGPIPATLGRLISLGQLWLENNRLSGSIPPELGNLGGLRVLALHNNQLRGPIPEELIDLPYLRTFLLAGNPVARGCLSLELRDWLGEISHDFGPSGPSLCLLRDLQLSDATLDPPFAESTTAYTAAVAGPVEEIVVTATLADANDRVTIRKGARTYANGAAVPLARRTNLITIEATPADGGPTQIVTVTVTRSRTDPIALPLRAGGDLVVMPAGVAATAADLFGESDVASVWLYSRATRAWDYSYFPRRDRGNFAIAGGDVLWVVAPVDQTLVVQGTPPASDPGPIALTLRQGGDIVAVPDGVPTTAAALFGGTAVASVWKYNRATRAWDLSYLPARDRGGFDIAPGDALWVVTPRALTVTAGSPADAAVAGRVTFGGGEVTLPEGAVVTVQLLDTSLADAAATIIGEQIIRDARGLPLAFRVDYDPAAIKDRNEYSLQATVRHDGRLLYINDTVHLVLTRGAPLDRDIEVIRVE